jgi:fructoselysine 6-kinase
VAALVALDGQQSAYFGAIGDDEEGRFLIEAAKQAGVDTDRVRVLSGRTGVTTVELDQRGERTFISEDYGASLDYRVTESDIRALCTYDWVHIARLPECEPVVESLVAAGVRVSIDFGTDCETFVDLAPKVVPEVAFFSTGNRDRAERIGAKALASGAALAVVTIGEDGSLVFSADGSHHEPTAAAEVVDTLGAGDAFIAAFIVARLGEESLATSMRAASLAAAAICARQGAWGELKPFSEVKS